MNRFDEEVRALLADTPPRPELADLKSRARRHRVRQSAVFVVIAAVAAVATVGVAGSLGHRSSSPHIAVSPTTSTPPSASAALCELRLLDTQMTQLQRLEKQLNDELAVELRNLSPNAGATDAAHQAVLRELSAATERVLRLKGERATQRALAASTPAPDDKACCVIAATSNPLPLAAFNEQYHILDTQRVQLESVERRLNEQLTEALAKHASNAGELDAQHQAVLRDEIDIQQRILRLDEARPSRSPCPGNDETNTSIAVSAP
jgi:hypothetical protein